MKSKTLDYTVFFQKEPDGGFTAYVPLLPGCVSYGKDLTEAKSMIEDAIKLYLGSLHKHGDVIPTEEAVFYSKVYIDSSSGSYMYA